MSYDITFKTCLNAIGRLKNSVALASAVEYIQTGQTSFPALTSTYTTGTSITKANNWSEKLSTVGAGAFDTIDLTNMVNSYGAVNFTSVKSIILALDETITSGKYLNIGPQNVANAWAGWEGATGATNYEQVFNYFYKDNPSGWAVGSTTHDFKIDNPTASTVTYRLWIVGVS